MFTLLLMCAVGCRGVGDKDTGDADSIGKVYTADNFKNISGKQVYRTAQQVSEDERMCWNYESGDALPYNYFITKAYMVVPTEIAGLTEKQTRKVALTLSRELFKADGSKPADIMNKSLARTSDFEAGNLVKSELPSNAGLGVQESFAYGYPTLSTDKFLVYVLEDGFYTGSGTGAGYSSTDRHFIISRTVDGDESMPQIYSELSSMIRPDVSDNTLLSLINDQLRAHMNGEDCVMTLAERVPRSLTVTLDGLGFVFSKYEVACGAAGNYVCEVPWEVITPYLTEDFAKLISESKNWKEMGRPEIPE